LKVTTPLLVIELATVEVEVLPDSNSPTLLGVLLPELAASGMGENRFDDIGGDIIENTEGKIIRLKKNNWTG
jgi:hypothetical protein